MAMYEVIGTKNPEYLLASTSGIDVIAVPVEPGNGVIPRGTVLYRKESGMYAPADSAAVVVTNNLVVLDEEVDTTANATIAEDAKAFRAAHLIAGKVKLAAGAAVTTAHAVVLRMQGLVLDQMDGAAEFNNVKE